MSQDNIPPSNDTTGGGQDGASVTQNAPLAGPATPANEYGALFCPLEYSEQKRNDFANAIAQFLYHALPTRNYFWNFVSVRQLGLNLPCLDAMTMIFYQLSQPTARAGNPKDVSAVIKRQFYPEEPNAGAETASAAADNKNGDKKPRSLPLPSGDLVEIHSVQDYLKQIFAWSRDEYMKICPPRQLNLKPAIANSAMADLEIYRATLDNSPLAEYFLVQSQIAYCCDGCDKVQLMDRLWFYNYMIEVDLVVDDGNQVPKEDISLQDYLKFIFCDDGKVKRKCNRGCKGDTMQRKNAQITRFPMYLIISLERVNKRNGHKHNRPVSVPLSLGLSNRGQSDMMYSLNSAVIHNGDLRKGRYSTLVRMVVNGKPSPMDKWVLLKNKTIVEGIEGQQATKLLTNFACLLMYKRVTDPPNQQMPGRVANAARVGLDRQVKPKPANAPKATKEEYDRIHNRMKAFSKEANKIHEATLANAGPPSTLPVNVPPPTQQAGAGASTVGPVNGPQANPGAAIAPPPAAQQATDAGVSTAATDAANTQGTQGGPPMDPPK